MFSTSSRSLKDTGKRSFVINNAYHIDGCKTKFSRKDYDMRLIGHSAQRASMKALTGLCEVKKIKGQCALYIEVRETTQGSKHKVYAYKCRRVKKVNPVIIPGQATRYFDSICKPVSLIPTKKCSKSRKTSGSMRSRRSASKSKKIKLIKKMKSKSSKTSKTSKTSKKTKSKKD